MKESWEYKKLGEVCHTSSGGTPSRTKVENYEDGKIPWLRSGEVAQGLIYNSEMFITEIGLKNSSAKLFPIDTVVLAMYGATVGQVGLLKKEMSTNQAICGIYPNNKFIPMFLLYTLKAKKSSFIKDAVGGAQPNISQNLIKNTLIPVPPLSEQQHIVEELDLLSSIIEKKKAQLKELDNLAQSIFYEMFGDPITNEKGWKIKPFKEIASFKNGLNYHPTDNGQIIKCIGVGDFQDKKELREFDQIKVFSINEVVDESYYLQDGDIIIVRSNGSRELVGRNMIIYPNNEKITYSGFCIRCRIFTTNILPIILNRILSNKSTMIVLRQEGRGCNISNINQKILSSLPIITPPIVLQYEYVQKVQSIEHQKDLIKQSITEVETLFNSRMDYYFN